jgi:hypothetical protein
MSATCNLPVDIPDDLVADVRGIDYRTPDHRSGLAGPDHRTVTRRRTE